MNITWVAPGTLMPYPGNAKQHPPEQVEHIANSIKRFGWQQPIVVDKNNVVVIGHGRLFAAKQLMLDTVPVVVADSLSEEEINALRLADNKTNESAWDFDKLEEELAALSIAGIDVTTFGFSDVDDYQYLEEIEEDEEQENGEKGKGTAWHTNDVRCDMKPNVATREKSGKRYISLYATSKEGKSLTEIKNSKECETQMVADFVKFVQMTFGSNLQDSGWCLLTTGRRRHREGYHFATSVCRAASEQLGLRFYEGAIECLNANRLKPKLEIKEKPIEKNIILFDDIITTGTTMRQTVDLLEHECYNIRCHRNQKPMKDGAEVIRLLIAGTRTFDNVRVFNGVIGNVIGEIKEDVLIVEGGAKGADTLAGEYAKANGIELVEMKPEWSKYGRAAGIKRNERMVKYAAEKNGVAVYFWDGKSKGTAHCIEYARKNGLRVMVFDFTGKRCA